MLSNIYIYMCVCVPVRVSCTTLITQLSTNSAAALACCSKNMVILIGAFTIGHTRQVPRGPLKPLYLGGPRGSL